MRRALALALLSSSAWAAPPMLKLDDAVQLALKQQPSVVQAHAQAAAAKARAEQALSVLLPQISANASYSRSHGSFTRATVNGVGSITGTGFSGTTPGTNLGVPGTVGATGTGVNSITATNSTFNLVSFGLSGSQLLWDFASIERLRSANALTESQRALERATRLQVALQARSLFFSVRAQVELLTVAREALTNQEKHLAQIQGFVKAGTRPDVDLAQARADVANSQLQAVDARANVDLAKMQLAKALGLPKPDFELGEDQLQEVAGEHAPLDTLVHEALVSRPELVSLERQKAAQLLLKGAAVGGFLPALSANASVSEAALPPVVDLTNNWAFGATLSWPLFTGGASIGQLHEAQANAEVAQAQADAEKLQISADVDSARLGVETALAAMSAAQDAVFNARERLRLAEGRYLAGVGALLDQSDAQLALTQAEAQEVQQRYQLYTARAQLLAALGRSK
jgi:outer membrane protein